MPSQFNNPFQAALQGLMPRPSRAVPNSAIPIPEIGADTGAAGVYGFNQGLRTEQRGRLANAVGLGDQPEIDKLKLLLGITEDEIASSPITAQGKQVAGIEAADDAAYRLGFDATPMGAKTFSPATTQAVYERQIGEEKMRQPLEQQKISSGAGVEMAREQGQQAMARAKFEQDAMTQRQNEFFNQFNAPQPGDPSGLRPGTSFNPKTGAFRQGSEPRPQAGIPNPLLQDVTRARSAWEQARGSGNEAQTQAVYMQSVQNAIQKDPTFTQLGPEGAVWRQYVTKLLTDPTLQGIPLQEALQLTGQTDLTPQEVMFLQNQLMNYRGY